MAQTWRQGTWAVGFWTETFWAGVDNAPVAVTSTQGNRFPTAGWSWFWSWIVVLLGPLMRHTGGTSGHF
jgi:hypothetical protein